MASRGGIAGSIGILAGLGLVWGLRFYGGAQTETYYLMFLFFLVPVLLTLWMGRAIALPGRRLIPVALVGAFLLGAIVLLPTLYGRGYVILALAWAIFFITFVLTYRNRLASVIASVAIVLVGCLEALYGLIQSFGGVDYIGNYYRGLGRMATGTLINHNHYAALLNLTVLFGVGLFLAYLTSRRGRRRRSEFFAQIWTAVVVVAVISLPIILSMSRAGIVVFFCSIGFLLLILFLKKRQGLGTMFPARAVWLSMALFLLLGLAGSVVVDALTERFSRVESDMSVRLSIYQDTIKLIGAHGLTGVGPRMYEWRFRPYQTLDADILVDHAHNDYLQTVAEWGIFPALLFWGFLLWRSYRSIRAFIRSDQLWRQGIQVGCAASIFSILLHSFVDFNLQIPVNLMVLGAVAALSWSCDEEPEGEAA